MLIHGVNKLINGIGFIEGRLSGMGVPSSSGRFGFSLQHGRSRRPGAHETALHAGG